MKKSASILLLLLLVLQSGGILLIYRLQQGFVQSQMTSRIQDRKTVFQKITLTKKQYQEFRLNADEIKIDGSLYDIRSAIDKGNRVELLALKDNEETQIVNAIRNFVHPVGSSNPGYDKSLVQLIATDYVAAGLETAHFVPNSYRGVLYRREQNLLCPVSDILTPPPQKV